MGKVFDGIVGKVLSSVRVDRDDTYVRIEFSDSSAKYVAVEGDCCSHSYWYEVLGVKGCIGGTVTGVRTLDMPDYEIQDEDDVDECVQVYGYAVDTTRGTVTFVFRNESNGYYGGWAFDTTAPSGTTWRHRIDSNDWRA